MTDGGTGSGVTAAPWWRQVYLCGKLGARLHPLESLAGYALLLPYLWLCNTPDDDGDGDGAVRAWFLRNAAVQVALFVPVALLPALATGKMFYVDIAWPLGVAAIGVQTLASLSDGGGAGAGVGSDLRRLLIGAALTVHGGRMGLGALALFFPYVLPEDLPRYRYARVRFVEEGGRPDLWIVKLAHDVLQQCFANVVLLGTVGVLASTDRTTRMSCVEGIGLSVWLCAWVFENAADVQKMRFVSEVRKLKLDRERRRERGAGGNEERHFTLGRAPFDGREYALWTWCRHPNYFGEWLAWVGLSLAVLPCAFRVPTSTQTEGGLVGGPRLLLVCCWVLCLALIPRFFYDCLLYWTGAAPAEHFSHIKRGGLYEEYQASTRVFFPFRFPYVNHAQTPGWSTLHTTKKGA